MTTLKIISIETGETVRTYDISQKSIHQQERFFDAMLHKTDLDRFVVTMDTPEDKP